MNHYDFPQKFRNLYETAVARFATGTRGADTFCTTEETAFLTANGLTAQNIYDYAEDHHGYDGEPGLANALAIELVRRDFFLNAQDGRRSDVVIDQDKLPPKTDAVRGIAWLPRLIPKARAKLRGELPPTLMFCCGGDRRFFKEHHILPAEFLAQVWRHEKDPSAVVEWVARRKAAK